ncbi:MAG: polysaccharide deacetylase family protein [Flavihumibacter sp.]
MTKPNHPTLFLTIDDFPSATAQQLLRLLRERQLPAVLFCVGNLLEKNKEAAVDAIKQGLILGNHSFSHKSFSLMTLDACLDDIKRCDNLLHELYDKAGITWRYKYFRFPYGDQGDGKRGRLFTRKWFGLTRSKKAAIQKELENVGYRNPTTALLQYPGFRKTVGADLDWSWTLDSLDWVLGKKESVFGLRTVDQLVCRLTSANPFECRGKFPDKDYGLPVGLNEVLLTHDRENGTDALSKIIDACLSAGYHFTMPEVATR